MKSHPSQEDTDTGMTHMTTLDELNQYITLLADAEETDAPFISCYLNLENGPAGWRDALDERARILRRLHKGNDLANIEEALWSATGIEARRAGGHGEEQTIFPAK